MGFPGNDLINGMIFIGIITKNIYAASIRSLGVYVFFCLMSTMRFLASSFHFSILGFTPFIPNTVFFPLSPAQPGFGALYWGERILFCLGFARYSVGKTKFKIRALRFNLLAAFGCMAENSPINTQSALREKLMMSNVIPLQNSPERTSRLSIAPGVDFATAVALRRMATSNGKTPFYLLSPEVSALLHYIPDRRHHFLFSTLWNTGARIGEACSMQPESFVLDGPRPFVRILSEKVRTRRGRPSKDEVRLVPLSDRGYVHSVESWLATARPKRREPLWAVTDETMRNWLKAAVVRASADGVHFSIPVTPHTFRHSFIMHMLYHRQPQKVVQALVGHKDTRSMEVYSRVFALDLAATLEVPFTGDGPDAAAVLRALPPIV